MKPFYIALLILPLISCDNNDNEHGISGVVVSQEFTLLDTAYSRLYFSGNLIIVQQTSPFPTTTFINGMETVTSSPRKYNTLIFSNLSASAVFLDSADLQTARIVNKDSMLKHEWAFSREMDSILNKSTLKKLSAIQTKEENVIQEYLVTNKKDTALTNTYFLEYSKKNFLNIPYSLFSALDNEQGSKLVRFTIKCDAANCCEGKVPVDSIELTRRLTPLEIDNPKEIQALFDYARKHLK